MRCLLHSVLKKGLWNGLPNLRNGTQGVKLYSVLGECHYAARSQGRLRLSKGSGDFHSGYAIPYFHTHKLTCSLTETLSRSFCTKVTTSHDLRGDNGALLKDGAGDFPVMEAVSYWTREFDTAGVPEPDSSAEYIVAHVLGHTAFSLVSPLARNLTAEERTRVWDLCKKRLNRMPIQYILGEWDFRNLNLTMRPPVFIPRPETEELVEHLWSHLQEDLDREEDDFDILEVGCGSGAISLSLLYEFPEAHCTAVDVTKEAVELTKHNAKRLSLDDRLEVKQMQFNTSVDFETKFDVIVSNPPYIWTKDMETLEQEIVGYENHCALHGGTDGMGLIRDIIHTGHRLLKPGGSIWLEVDPRHPDMIQNYLDNHLQYHLQLTGVYHDFNDRPRFCCLELVE